MAITGKVKLHFTRSSMAFILPNCRGVDQYVSVRLDASVIDGAEVLRSALIYRVGLVANPSIFFGGEMENRSRVPLTLLPDQARVDDDRARNDLIAMIYQELRDVAARMMQHERKGHTLPPTAVVHEAVMRILGEEVFERASDRDFLVRAAARAMREILVDHARRKSAGRRGGTWERVPLDSLVDYFESQSLDVAAVHEAIDRLTELNERQGQAMTLRYFGGLTVPEIASALDVSVATVERDCRLARAWLHGQLRDGRSE
jgi:RNA polymerase sigma-70 factor, ECF subfamily